MKVLSMLWLSAMLLAFLPTSVTAQNVLDSSLSEPVDIQQLKTTWRNLANEQVMFPLDMQDIAVKIGRERQLLVDNRLLARADNVSREVHRPRRHPANPVFKAARAELNQAVVQNVLKFETSPRFRMWYTSWDDWLTLPSGQLIRFGSSYAVSDDGVHWRRPELNLHTIKGLVGPILLERFEDAEATDVAAESEMFE